MFKLREFAIERVIEIDFTLPHAGAWSVSDPNIDQIVTSLRILGPGKVAAPQTNFEPSALGELVTFAASSWSAGNTTILVGSKYNFEPSRAEDLRTVFAYLTNSTLPTPDLHRRSSDKFCCHAIPC